MNKAIENVLNKKNIGRVKRRYYIDGTDRHVGYDVCNEYAYSEAEALTQAKRRYIGTAFTPESVIGSDEGYVA